MAGEAAALGSALLWAVSNILMGSQSGRMPAAVISALRILFALAVLLAVAAAMALSGAARYPTLPTALALAGSGALGLGVGDTVYIRSLRHIGVSRAFPISTAVYPLLTFVLAVMLLGERVTLPVMLGAALIVGGTMLVVLGARAPASLGEPPPPAREVWLGVGMVLVTSVLWALASVWLRDAAEGVQPAVAQMCRMPAAVVVTVVMVHGSGHTLSPRGYSRRSLWAVLLAGAVGTGVGSILFVVAVQDAGAARTAVLSSTAPLFALPLAVLVLRERVTGRVLLGTFISIAGIWLVVTPS